MKTSDTPWLIKRLRNGETIPLSNLPDDLPAYATRDREYLTEAGIKSALALPLQTGALAMGGLLVFSKQEKVRFRKERVRSLRASPRCLRALSPGKGRPKGLTKYLPTNASCPISPRPISTFP